VEVVAPGPDVNHDDTLGLQPLQHISAQGEPDAASLRLGVYRDHFESSRVAIGDVPSDIAEDSSLLFGNRDEPMAVRI
jgi:hypothetical protein